MFVTGIVEEAETGEKLFGATVSIADKNGTKALTATDKNGTFCLTTNRGTIKPHCVMYGLLALRNNY